MFKNDYVVEDVITLLNDYSKQVAFTIKNFNAFIKVGSPDGSNGFFWTGETIIGKDSSTTGDLFIKNIIKIITLDKSEKFLFSTINRKIFNLSGEIKIDNLDKIVYENSEMFFSKRTYLGMCFSNGKFIPMYGENNKITANVKKNDIIVLLNNYWIGEIL